MAVIAFLALTLGLGFWILRPLMSHELFQTADYAPASELKDLLVLRDVAYDTLRDLEFDFRMGKMAEKDYQELKARYQGEAAEILRQVEDLEGQLEVETRKRSRRAVPEKNS
jgi:Skp family chaperone for outer membrane proteins